MGVERFVAQSFAGWPYPREGAAAKSEEDPLDPTPAAAMRSAHAAIRHVEEAVTGAEWTEGIVLRYGGFYGPGTGFSLPDGDMVEMIRERKVPLIGNGAGIWSFIHIDDAATATVAAVEHGRRGIYNVVDDEPAPAAEWIPAAAKAVGAKPPRHVPRWLARILAGEAAVVMMTEVRGALNDKAKRELGWQPTYASWRQGFAARARVTPCSTERRSPSCARGRSRSPTGCSAASARRRTSSRRRSSASTRAERRRADLLAAGLDRDGRHPARDRRAALGSCRGASATSASGCRSRC